MKANIALPEPFSSYVIRKLEPDERIKSFDCGDADLNDFILNEADDYRKALLAVTYVLESPEDTGHEHIVAYFSLANDRVSLSDFESKTKFRKFRQKRFVQEKQLRSYPAAKICRLGVDMSARDLHIGTFLISFIKSYFIADNKTGCRFLTVDAYRDALPFYYKNLFVPLNNDDQDSHTRLLFFDLNDIADEE